MADDIWRTVRVGGIGKDRIAEQNDVLRLMGHRFQARSRITASLPTHHLQTVARESTRCSSVACGLDIGKKSANWSTIRGRDRACKRRDADLGQNAECQKSLPVGRPVVLEELSPHMRAGVEAGDDRR